MERKARPGRSKPAVGRSKAPRGGGPAWPRVRRWLVRVVGSVALGATLGVLMVLFVLYRGALATVEARLAGGPVFTVPGHVWSGPLEVWPGMALTPEELAVDLVAAGYARVPVAEQPGDVQAAGDAVLVKGVAREGPGWTTRAGDVLVTFRDGRVASVTPGGRGTFAATRLQTVRGADNETRSPVPLARIPVHVREAVLAVEDARFYEHPGVDALGIARALWADIRAGAMVQGGSTLTQQLVKNVFLTQERTALRKFKEMLLALALEQRLSKDQILEMYLNEVYLGQAAGSSLGGVDAAARAWFDKPVERVTVGEGAMLAGIISSPNTWSPTRDPDAAKERRDVALERMVDAGFLDRAEADRVRDEPLFIHASVKGRRATWAADLALEAVEEVRGVGAVARDALEVHTTLSPTLQRLAERALAEGMAEVVAAHPEASGAQAALVVVRARDGAVLALVGGRDYATSGYNRAVNARRPVGSTIKALTTLVALDVDPSLSGGTVLDDQPITRTHDGKSWSPANYDGVFVGPVSLRRALATSRNVPAVLLAERVGLRTLKAKWRAMGLSGATDYPSAALGGFDATPLELAGAYSALAGDRTARSPWLTRAALAADGAVVWSAPAPAAGHQASAQAAWRTWELLRGVITEGTGKRATAYGVGPGAVGKTGTTDEARDAWFAGVSGPLAVVAWVGFDRNERLGLTGGEAALPIWARFVAWSGTSASPPSPPKGVVKETVCRATGLPPCPSCAEEGEEWFAAGHVPERQCGPLPEVREAVEEAAKGLRGLLGLGRRQEPAGEPAPAEAPAPR